LAASRRQYAEALDLPSERGYLAATMRFQAAATLVALCATSCGGSATPEPGTATQSETPAETAPDATAAPAKGSPDVAADDGTTVPTDCKQNGELCLPSAAFTKRLCSGMNPDVALAFFKKGTPFSRAYMKMNVDAWNASGGASSADKLVFDEEVIILLSRKNETGIQVSGASGGYDVLRWDGTCATLSAEEVTLSVPPKPKNAKVVWKDFSEATQNALLGDPAIAKLNKERRDECKGASIGEVSKKCVTLVDKLSEAIVSYVRNGGEVPPPAKLK
jgi:hypothetical protein